jgi:hypothetical protein
VGLREGTNRSGDLREPPGFWLELVSQVFKEGRRRKNDGALIRGRVAADMVRFFSSAAPSYFCRMDRDEWRAWTMVIAKRIQYQ